MPGLVDTNAEASQDGSDSLAIRVRDYTYLDPREV